VAGIVGNDDAIGRVTAVVEQGAGNKPGERERDGRAGIPEPGCGSAGLVAGRAVDLQVGTDAKFDAGGGIFGSDKGF